MEFKESDEHRRLHVKIRRGKQPKLEHSSEEKTIVVTIPVDQDKKWPPLSINLIAGFNVTLQRMERQYKIAVQHSHCRKPEFVVFVAPLTHEGELRTSIGSVQATHVQHVGISGPNMEITGHLRAPKLTLESSIGALQMHARVATASLTLQAQHVHIATEALLGCEKLQITARRVQIDGQVFCDGSYSARRSGAEKLLIVTVDAALLHVGVDGTIGAMRTKMYSLHDRKADNCKGSADWTLLTASGCIANYGRILAKEQLELDVAGSVITLQDGRIDSAARGYNALKQIHALPSQMDASSSACNEPSSSRLGSAILDCEADTVAHLLESGVDPNDKNEEQVATPKRIASLRLKKLKKTEEKRAAILQRISLINALFTAHNWKRGLFSAPIIKADIGKHCEDCAQFNGTELLQLTVKGSAIGERDSIWSSGDVELNVNEQIQLRGQSKFRHLNMTASGNIVTTEHAIVNVEGSAKVTTHNFRCAGVWFMGHEFDLTTTAAVECLGDSFLEAERMTASIAGTCTLSGTWQSDWGMFNVVDDVLVTSTGRIIINNSLRLQCKTLQCNGQWHIKETISLLTMETCNFFHGSKLECSTLKLRSEKHCTLGGQWTIATLFAFVSEDMITTSTGRCHVEHEGNMAVGNFQNGNHWQAERNLHMHLGGMSQSEDGILFVKQILNLHFYGNGVDAEVDWLGRVVANVANLHITRTTRCGAFVRVNEMIVDLPMAHQSRLVLTGQVEVLIGPLVVKGCGDFTTISSSLPHCFPALVIDGILKAAAIVAPFLPIKFGTRSYVQLSGMRSVVEVAPFKVLINCAALHTQQSSMIEVYHQAENESPEAIICASTWFHEGCIRFSQKKVFLFADSFMNCGRLTASRKFVNHMQEVVFRIDKELTNRGVLSADSLTIYGDGVLNNRNRIFAVESLSIKLRNFNNEGNIEAEKDMRLLCDTSELTNIGGKLKARDNVNISANRMSLNKSFNLVNPVKRMSFQANTELQLHSNILQNSVNCKLQFKAAAKIVFDAELQAIDLDLELGQSNDTEEAVLHVTENGIVRSVNVTVHSNCKRVCIIIDGELTTNVITITGSVESCIIRGSSPLSCTENFSALNSIVILESKKVNVARCICRRLEIAENITTQLGNAENDTNKTIIIADEIRGQLKICGKLELCARNEALTIDGHLEGVSKSSELIVDCKHLIVSATLSKLQFVEMICSGSITIDNTTAIADLANLILDSQQLHVSGTMTGVNDVLLNGNEIVIHQASWKSDQLNVDGKTLAVTKSMIETKAKCYLSTRTSIRMDADSVLQCSEDVFVSAKWIHLMGLIKNCSLFTATAWTLLNEGNIIAEETSLTALAVILNTGNLSCKAATCATPFAIFIGENKKQNREISRWKLHALALLTNNPCIPEQADTSALLQIHFTEEIAKELQRSNAISEILNVFDKHTSPTAINVTQILTLIRHCTGLPTVTAFQSTDTELYKKLQAYSRNLIDQGPNSFELHTVPKLLRDLLQPDPDPTTEAIESANAKFCMEHLYSRLQQFSGSKIQVQRRSSRTSPDQQDVGYSSHGSSDGFDDRSLASSLSKEMAALDQQAVSPAPNCVDQSIMVSERQAVNDKADADMKSREELSYPDFDEPFEYPQGSLVDETESASDDGSSVSELFCNGKAISPNRFALVNLKAVVDTVFVMPVVRAISQNTSTDLLMKRIQVKRSICNIRTSATESLYGSQLSLTSLNSEIPLGTPMVFERTPLRRSLIPRVSQYQQSRDTVILKNEAMLSPIRQ